jgi:hypothetical protein
MKGLGWSALFPPAKTMLGTLTSVSLKVTIAVMRGHLVNRMFRYLKIPKFREIQELREIRSKIQPILKVINLFYQD